MSVIGINFKATKKRMVSTITLELEGGGGSNIVCIFKWDKPSHRRKQFEGCT